ncbi:MAG: hypothetical protein R2742_03340 [Micropruina glycogenica]
MALAAFGLHPCRLGRATVLGLAFGVHPPAALLVGLTLLQVALPVHGVLVEFGPVGVQMEHLGDDRFEQPDVVADQDHPTRVRLQKVAQPDDRVGVQVVGRLVEQQVVCARE